MQHTAPGGDLIPFSRVIQAEPKWASVRNGIKDIFHWMGAELKMSYMALSNHNSLWFDDNHQNPK